MNDDTIFVIDRDTGRLVLTTLATHLKPGLKIPLWWHEPESDAAMTALCVWLGEQRAHWPQWRAIAERDGPTVVADAIAQQWSGGIEACGSVMLTPGEDRREITVRAMLVTRTSVIGRHRFESVAHAKAFLTWFLSDIPATSFFLLAEGCLIGPDNLGRVMDAVAEDQLQKPQAKIRSRKSRRRPSRQSTIAA